MLHGLYWCRYKDGRLGGYHGACDNWGCAAASNALPQRSYGAGARYRINTDSPYKVRVGFPTDGRGELSGVHVELSQGSTVLHVPSTCDRALLHTMTRPLKEGMALVASHWGTATWAAWLSAPPCPEKEACFAKADASISGIAVNGVPIPSPPPSPPPTPPPPPSSRPSPLRSPSASAAQAVSGLHASASAADSTVDNRAFEAAVEASALLTSNASLTPLTRAWLRAAADEDHAADAGAAGVAASFTLHAVAVATAMIGFASVLLGLGLSSLSARRTRLAKEVPPPPAPDDEPNEGGATIGSAADERSPERRGMGGGRGEEGAADGGDEDGSGGVVIDDEDDLELDMERAPPRKGQRSKRSKRGGTASESRFFVLD